MIPLLGEMFARTKGLPSHASGSNLRVVLRKPFSVCKKKRTPFGILIRAFLALIACFSDGYQQEENNFFLFSFTLIYKSILYIIVDNILLRRHHRCRQRYVAYFGACKVLSSSYAVPVSQYDRNLYDHFLNVPSDSVKIFLYTLFTTSSISDV